MHMPNCAMGATVMIAHSPYSIQYNYIQLFCLFQVYLRIRPMNEDEILIGATHIAHKLEDRVS